MKKRRMDLLLKKENYKLTPEDIKELKKLQNESEFDDDKFPPIDDDIKKMKMFLEDIKNKKK